MIRIFKSQHIPLILRNEGEVAKNALIDEYSQNSSLYTSRPGISSRQVSKMIFDNSIYGDSSVKDQLKSDQYYKCCYCEASFYDNSFGDVEHYRPKQGYYKHQGTNKLTYPGYYWLAYNWENLLYSCEICNRRHKKNNFPLAHESTRVLNHQQANRIQDEDCLLIDPVKEDPSRYITFVKEVPVAINDNLKGKTSIKVYGLERLNDTRLEYIKLLKAVLVLSNIDENDPAQLQEASIIFNGMNYTDLIESIKYSKQLYGDAAKVSSKFTLCIRSNFPNLPI